MSAGGGVQALGKIDDHCGHPRAPVIPTGLATVCEVPSMDFADLST